MSVTVDSIAMQPLIIIRALPGSAHHILIRYRVPEKVYCISQHQPSIAQYSSIVFSHSFFVTTPKLTQIFQLHTCSRFQLHIAYFIQFIFHYGIQHSCTRLHFQDIVAVAPNQQDIDNSSIYRISTSTFLRLQNSMLSQFILLTTTHY